VSSRVSTTAARNAARRLGSYLRSLRRRRGLTQAQAGEVVGVDAVTIRRWELGHFSPSPENLERVAAVYGVSVAALVHSASPASQETLEFRVPVRGYIEAGLHRDTYEVDLGMIPLPQVVLESHPRAFSLIASGDALVADGIHNDDILVVDPDSESRAGSLCIVRLGSTLCVTTFITSGVLRLRTASGHSEDLDASSLQIVGKVVWHFRKM